MTVLVGIVDSGRVLLGADTWAVDGDGVIWVNPKKINALNVAGERVLFATAGRTAIGAAIRYGLTIEALPEDTDDAADEWAQAIAEAFSELARERKLVDKDEEVDGAGFLAWRSHLWEISDALALRIQSFAAVGSGAQVARGALDVLLGEGVPASTAAFRACEVACRHITNCGGDLHLSMTDPAEGRSASASAS